MEHQFLMFLDHTQRRTTVGRTFLDEWSARRRDLYLTTHNTHNRQISMPPVGFEPTISAGERPQTYALDRAATETGAIRHITVSKESATYTIWNSWLPLASAGQGQKTRFEEWFVLTTIYVDGIYGAPNGTGTVIMPHTFLLPAVSIIPSFLHSFIHLSPRLHKPTNYKRR